MNIIYIHQYFTTPEIGGGTRSYEFARYLVKKGHKVTIICGSSELEKKFKSNFNRYLNSFKIENIELLVVKADYSQHFSYFKRVLSFMFFLIGACLSVFKIKKADLVIASSTPLTVSIVGLLAKIYFRIPFVFEVRDLWPEYIEDYEIITNKIIIKILKLLSKITYKFSNKIIVISPPMIERISLNYNTSKNKMICIPMGADLHLAKNIRNDIVMNYKTKYNLDNKFIIGYSGTLGFVNNVQYLLELAEKLLFDKDIVFLIVGDGKEKENLIKETEIKNLKNVIFLNQVSKQKIFSILSLFDLALITTNPFNNNGVQHINAYDNLSNKFFDYLAASKPVIINSDGIIAQYLEKYNCGKLLNPSDIISATKTILNLKSNTELVKSMSVNVKLLAEEHFDRFNMAELFEKTLLEARS
jgi:glycosyltransferase involved in cell wall biosynthesis